MTPPSETAPSNFQVETNPEDLAEKPSKLRHALLIARKQPLAATGLFIIIAMVLMALFAEFFTSFPPEDNNLEFMLEPPTKK